MLLTLTLLVMGFVTTSAQVVKIGIMGSAVGLSSSVDDIKMFPLDGENYYIPSRQLQKGTLYFRQDESVLWGATAFPSGTAVKNSEDRISILEAGNYTINFNRVTGAYSIIKDGSTTTPVITEPITPIPNLGRNIYVKREGSTTAPKIHVWTNDSGKDIAITNTASWPNNLPAMTADGFDWFKYTVTANSIGTLFRYGTFQTPDYKYYTQDVWITLNADGSQKSVTHTDPRANIVFNPSVPVQADGCLVENQEVYVYMGTEYPNGVVYYTVDGTDPIPNVGSTMIAYSSVGISAVQPRLKAVVYANDVRVSNIITKDFCFKKGVVNISLSPAPNANGKYTVGQKVLVTMTSNVTGFPIWYTTDGTVPYYISGSKQEYTVPFEITANSEIRANLYLGGGWRYGRYTETSEKSVQFEQPVQFPSFSYSTNPGAKDNGSYNAGTPVQVTFYTTPIDNNFDIYYSLDGNDVDLTKIGGQSYGTNPIRYTGPFTVSENKVVYAKFLHVPSGQSQGISPMNFVFEQNNTKTIWVKRQSPFPQQNPKIHVWSKETGVDVPITNTSNWPANLPNMDYTGDGWYKYTVNKSQLGVLFRYSDKQTVDFKYFTTDTWILLDTNGNKVSVTDYKPYEEVPVVLNLSKSLEPKANGKYNLGTSVTATFTSNGGAYNRYIAYTTDGSDPKTSTTYSLIVINQYAPTTLVINSNTNLRAIEEGIYRAGPYSNEVAFNFQFEPSIIATITKDIAPKSNGKYTAGQTVNVTLGRTEGCGGCSYADFYTVDGSDPKTSATRIAGSFVTLPITQTTTIRAFSYPVMGNSDHYAEVSETLTFEPATPLYRVYVKRQSSTQENPKFHVWTKESGVDVPITNTSNWPSNLPYMNYTGSGWYFYEVQKNQFGFLFKYSDKQTVDFKYYSQTVWVLLDANGNTVSITDTMPAASKEVVEVTELEKVFTVSPNPVSSNFTVNYSTGTEENIQLNIYSLAGQLLYTESFQNIIKKDFSAQDLRLSSGTYIVQVQSASGVETKKIIVE